MAKQRQASRLGNFKVKCLELANRPIEHQGVFTNEQGYELRDPGQGRLV